MKLLAVLTLAAGIYSWSQDWLYMAMNLIVLWFPAFLLFAYAYPRLSNWYRISFYTILLVMCNLCVIIEYIALQFDWWNFSEAVDKLSPWKVGNIPLEEFAFWFGGSAEVMVLYLALSAALKDIDMQRGELGLYISAAAFSSPLMEICHDFLIRVHASEDDKKERELKRGYRAFVTVDEISAEIREALGKETA